MAQASMKNTAGKKPKGSLYADVPRLQVQAKKFLDTSKFEQCRVMIEKALREHDHQDAIIHF